MAVGVTPAVLGLVLAVGCGDAGDAGEMPWNDLEVTSGDVTLHVWTYGGHEGAPVLLFLHGGPGESHDYLTGFSRHASPELRLVWSRAIRPGSMEMPCSKTCSTMERPPRRA